MRIAVIGPAYPIRGGISHYTSIMVQNMRSRHNVLHISYRKQYPDFLYPGRTQLDDSKEPVIGECEPLLSFINPLSWTKAARRACKFEPDILVLTWVSPALAVQFRLISWYVKQRSPRTSIIFLCHNVVQHERRPFDSLLTRFAIKNGDHFIVHGIESRDKLLALEPGAAVTNIALPTFDFFASRIISRHQARCDLGLVPDAAVALYFGFVRPYKGLKHLIAAVPTVIKEVPEFHLLVVGEFWESRTMYERTLAANGIQGVVTIVDRYIRNEEVTRYFSAADLIILPYISATGSAIVQVAYGFRKPVLTTRVGGLPEVVEHGVTGYLVEPGDPWALAQAMIEFFKQGRSTEFARNIELTRSNFSWDSLVEAIEAVIADPVVLDTD